MFLVYFGASTDILNISDTIMETASKCHINNTAGCVDLKIKYI